MNRNLCCVLSASFAAVTFSVAAQTPAVPPPAAAPPPPAFAASNMTPNGVRSLAATCAACHGTSGNSVGGAVPGLAGVNKEYFVTQFKAFKDGKREATIMHQLARGYTDAEVSALGDFFSAQKK